MRGKTRKNGNCEDQKRARGGEEPINEECKKGERKEKLERDRRRGSTAEPAYCYIVYIKFLAVVELRLASFIYISSLF